MSFTGFIAEMPLGQAGFSGSKNLSQVAADQLIQADNISYEAGTLQKCGGSTIYNNSATGYTDIIGGWDWWPAAGTQHQIIVTVDGDIRRSTGGNFTDVLKSGLACTISTVPVFTEGGKESSAGNKKLFIFTGTAQVQVLSGTGLTTADIGSPAADWASAYPTWGFIHEGRLFAGGNTNDGHRVYYSTTSDHENISGGGTISVFPGEGDRIIAGVSFKGLAILFKQPAGIYVIDTSDPTPTNWRVTRHSKDVGIAGPQAFAIIEDDIIFMDMAGNVHLLSSIQEFGNFGVQSLTSLAQIQPYLREHFKPSFFGITRCVWYSAKREVWFTLAHIDNILDICDALMIIDFNRREIPRFSFRPRSEVSSRFYPSMWLRRDTDNIPRPVRGTNNGFVYLMDSDARDEDTVAYEASFQTAHTDLSFIDPSLATKVKNFHFLELIVEPQGNWNVTFDIFLDGELKETKTFNMGTTGAVLGSFVLGTDALAGEGVVTKKRRITGQGRRISLRGRNAGADENFSISKAYLHFTRGDERGAGV